MKRSSTIGVGRREVGVFIEQHLDNRRMPFINNEEYKIKRLENDMKYYVYEIRHSEQEIVVGIGRYVKTAQNCMALIVINTDR